MTKGNYVEGFVLVIPKKNVPAYKKMAKEGKEVWMKFGALDYKECMGSDLTPGLGDPSVSFMTLAKAKPSETVWFSYIVYKNKKHHDDVTKKVMDYFSKKYANASAKDLKMPFDERRTAKGGFTIVVQ